MKRTAQELARMIREAYPGASGVALDAADALDEACVEVARLRRREADLLRQVQVINPLAR